MAVLDHLGEIMLCDQDISIRFEAENVERKTGERGESLVFKVKSVAAMKNLKGTSFEEWMSYPFTEPAITGEVTLTLAKDKPLIYLQYRLTATGNYDALDIVVVPALELLDIAHETGITKYNEAAKKALEYCMKMERPEGGDFWETPLHAPNLFAAGHAAVAYYEAYKVFGDVRYKDKSVFLDQNDPPLYPPVGTCRCKNAL